MQELTQNYYIPIYYHINTHLEEKNENINSANRILLTDYNIHST